MLVWVCACACICVFRSGYKKLFPTKFRKCAPAPTCMAHLELKAQLSEGSEFLEQVWAHLVEIGRRKKGPCVLGTGSKSLTQPKVTPAQHCTEPANTGKRQQLPPYSFWLLANSQYPWVKGLFFFSFSKPCLECRHSFHFNLGKLKLPWARWTQRCPGRGDEFVSKCLFAHFATLVKVVV